MNKLVLALSALALGVEAHAQPIRATPLVSGLVEPVEVAHAPGDASRLFVIERAGKIRVVRLPSGTLLSPPFLDIDPLVKAVPGDTGLLGLAFDPSYQTSGHFYVSYTAEPEFDHALVRYSVSVGNPDLANPNSALLIWRYKRPLGHTSGWIGFRPTDGFLYLGSGDAGTAAVPDPLNASQRLDLVFGKILRIDPSSDEFPADPNRNYSIPLGNPFGRTPGAAPEIWDHGIRNPWRCSFDRDTGDFWIADVGENEFEEVDVELVGDSGGHNYGWKCLDATFCTGYGGCDCSSSLLKAPTFSYPHSQGVSITGGYVYRGRSMASFVGRYIFADFAVNRIFSTRLEGGIAEPFLDHSLQTSQGGVPIDFVSCFGEDDTGELYVTSYFAGKIYRIDAPACYADCEADGTLSIDDFICFQTLFAIGDGSADCDSDAALTIDDFICYQTYFAIGC
jgi:glucose/arabinose dehydrogenase